MPQKYVCFRMKLFRSTASLELRNLGKFKKVPHRKQDISGVFGTCSINSLTAASQQSELQTSNSNRRGRVSGGLSGCR